MWFLFNKVILTKDNLAKRQWNGCKKCVFCDSEESIDHLFFTCPFAHGLWTIVQYAFNIIPPSNVSNMFGNWLHGVEKKTKAQIRVGTCALVWSLWNYRNDIIFNKHANTNFFRVIHMATHFIHSGLSCYRRRNERLWISDAPLWRRSLRISTTGVAGGLLNAYKMHMQYVLLIFCWLIFVYTISDP